MDQKELNKEREIQEEKLRFKREQEDRKHRITRYIDSATYYKSIKNYSSAVDNYNEAIRITKEYEDKENEKNMWNHFSYSESSNIKELIT